MMKSEKGFALVEVMVAIVLMGIVSVALLSGISTAYMAVSIADERATAESLARTQMECVKNQGYIDYSSSGHAEYQKISPPGGYDIELSVVLMDPKGDGASNDDGLQRITVAVSFPGREAVTLVGYKSWR